MAWVNVIPRDVLGVPIIVFALLCRPMPPRVADAMNALTLMLAVGNLGALGLDKRDHGPFAEIVEGRHIPVLDIGTLARIKSGEITVRNGIESFDGSAIHFADGTREHFDAVVLATGFRSGMASMCPRHPEILDSQATPRSLAPAPGIYFCGYDVSNARTGLLRRIGVEARRIADAIGEA